MYYVSKRMEIAGSHRLNLSYESKCENLHGHNWVVTVCCRVKTLNRDGMVCDFKHIKDQIHGYLDHGNFNEYYLQPCDTKDASGNSRIVAGSIDYIKGHPQWHLSLQTQKIIHVR